jgi:hypothetical protein
LLTSVTGRERVGAYVLTETTRVLARFDDLAFLDLDADSGVYLNAGSGL